MPHRFASLGLAMFLAALMLALLAAATRQAVAAALPEPAAGNTYPGSGVCSTSLQACIDGTAIGSRVTISAGTYVTSVTLDRAVSLVGTNSANTILRALSNQRVITVTGATITSSTIISGLTFAGGFVSGGSCPAGCGGAMLVAGSATPLLQNLVISSSTALLQGGGLYANAGSPLTLRTVTLISNTTMINSGGGLFTGDALTLTDVSVLNNRAPGGSGGGIRAQSTVNAQNSLFQNNHSFNSGGGMRVVGVSVIATSVFSGNTAGIVISNSSAVNGGGLRADSDADIQSSTFLSNATSIDGGGAYISGTLSADTAIFLFNSALGNGGGLYTTEASQCFLCSLQGNHAGQRGGGLFAQATFHDSFSSIMSNSAGTDGGGVYAAQELALSGSQLTQNSAVDGGGAAFALTATVNQAATVLGNTARHGDGGGLLVEGALSGNQAVFQQNQSGGHGGGAFVTGTVSLQDSQFILNAAHGEVGGGLFARGSAAITNSLFLTNTADFSPTALLAGDPAGAEPTTSLNGPAAGSPEGGGLFANHDVNLLNNLFMNNHATFNGHGIGGGVRVLSSFPATSHGDRFISNTAGTQGGGLEANNAITLTGDTFWGNAAAQAGGVDLSGPGGGVIANTLFADNVVSAPATSAAALRVSTITPLSLLNDTLANSSAVAQTGVVVQGGPVFVTDTIVAGYGTALNGAGIVEGHNLFFDNGMNTVGVTSIGGSFTADPLFVDPAGGDFHITFASPARDAGVDVGLLTDFDGDPRPSGLGFDIGYDELAELNLFLPLIMR